MTKALSAEQAEQRGRVEALFEQRYRSVAMRADRMFGALMLAQWLAGILVALWLAPELWSGRGRTLDEHVLTATVLGGVIASLPIALIVTLPGALITRLTVSVAQMLWSGLLIHLTGGRIETHFHVFGSLAFLAFYRDPWILVPATLVTAVDHFARGVYWPESVYGVANPEWWRFLEHAGWVVFIDTFLVINCIQSRKELWELSRQHVEISDAQERAVRVERLAAVGELAASVGHELRNPLAAISNAHAFVRRRLVKDGVPLNPKVVQFLDLMERELEASGKIIAGLLDFARTRQPNCSPTQLRPLADEALGIIPPPPPSVRIVNQIPDDLPAPEVDRDQFRQVLANLVQNAVEAMPEGHDGEVLLIASAPGSELVTLSVKDNGPGMSAEVREKVFQPLFSTKTKGTGLGLAVVSGIVEKHGGKISVESAPGRGTTFTVELPTRSESLQGS